jgi:serine protease AprX
MANIQRYSIYKVTPENQSYIIGRNITAAASIGAVFADLNQDEVEKLRALGFIVSPIRETTVPHQITTPTPLTPGGLSYTASDLLKLTGLDVFSTFFDPPIHGEGINYAMLDTGIRKTHADIGKIVLEKDFTGSGDSSDGFGHGTGVASLITSIAPQAGIINLRIMNSSGMGTEEAAAMAIDFIANMYDNADPLTPYAVNISAGSPDDGNPNNIVRVACRELISRGIIIITAAGNGGPSPGTITCPACERYVGAVGSVNEVDYQVSTFSSRGPTQEGLVKPDMSFFGENIEMASNKSDTATVVKSGTSFASALSTGIWVVGVEAIIRSITFLPAVPPGVDPNSTKVLPQSALIDDWLPKMTVKSKVGFTSGKDNDVGWGVPLGTLLALSLRPAGLDITTLISPLMMVMTIGMMTKVMRTLGKRKKLAR